MNTDRRTAWARVHDALDEGRDPLADERVQEWFAAHPEDLADYARMERRLRALALPADHVSRVVTAPWTRVGLAVAAAAAVVAIVWFATADRAARTDAPDDAQLARDGDDRAPSASSADLDPETAGAPAPRIVRYRVSTTRSSVAREFHASRGSEEPLRITDSRAGATGVAPTDATPTGTGPVESTPHERTVTPTTAAARLAAILSVRHTTNLETNR